ncbi:MAG: alpha/beta hydrolase [Phycisphaerae bacterium]|nr:alpha/beta hydrolase [Phycisphaerae bacterium]
MHRHLKTTIVCSILVALVFPAQAFAAEPPVELLWPAGAPDAKGDTPGDKPTLTIYLPEKDKATGAAVVICPGGGYGHLAMDHEGHQIAQWLNSFGVAGVILTYRHRGSGAGYGYPAPLQDAQRAIRTVRSRAAEWGIKPDRIGILGFSAGGHLASTAETHFDDKVYDASDAIDSVSARPDFAVLVYPVVSMAEPYTHSGSVQNLLGRNPSQEMLDKMSGEKQVTAQTPPTFLIATWEDTAVPAENSIYFYLALRKAKVPAEMHIFAKGPHGFGLGAKIPGTNVWPSLCAKWMDVMGLLKTE